MKVDSLKDLESAFGAWRRRKKYRQEPVPEELVSRARRAAEKHGFTAVGRVTRIERARLVRKARGARRDRTSKKARGLEVSGDVPAFSRLQLGASTEPRARPLAEIETAVGVRLRVYEETPEMLRLLSAACGLGGVR